MSSPVAAVDPTVDPSCAELEGVSLSLSLALGTAAHAPTAQPVTVDPATTQDTPDHARINETGE